MSGLELIDKARKAGFSDADIFDGISKIGSKAVAAGFSPQDVLDYYGMKDVDETSFSSMFSKNISDFHAAQPVSEVADQPVAAKPKPKPLSLVEAMNVGFSNSTTGLMVHGKVSDQALSDSDPWYNKVASSATQAVGDLPTLVGGTLVGMAGAAETGPLAPAIGFGVGMAFNENVRQSLIDSYKNGAYKSFGDWWDRILPIAAHTAKAGIEGASMVFAGGSAATTVGKAIAPMVESKTISAGTAMAAETASKLAAEYGTMVNVGAALDGKIPSAKDFEDGAYGFLGAIIGMKAAEVAPEAISKTKSVLMDTFVKAGKSPAEVVVDAKRDPTIYQDIVQGIVPKSYEQFQTKQPEQDTQKKENDVTQPVNDAAISAIITPPEIAKHLENEFGEDATSLLDAGKVKIVQSVEELNKLTNAEHPDDARGMYDPASDTTFLVADNLKPVEGQTLGGVVKGIALHEVGVHAGMEEMLGPDLYSKVLDTVNKNQEEPFVNARSIAEENANRPEHVPEETLAYLVENHQDLPIVKQLLANVRQWLYRKTGGRFINLTDADIASMAVASLRRQARLAAKESGDSTPFYSRAKQTETPEFKKWFGESKMVDAEGKPMVVYHGTDADITAFDRAGLGSHFTPDYRVASEFSESFDNNQKVFPVYLNLKNPLRIKDSGLPHSNATTVAEDFVRQGILPDGYIDDAFYARIMDGVKWPDIDETYQKNNANELINIRKIIEKQGYDGLVYVNTVEGGGDSYVAFHPEQVKSATGNSGAFDANNPDIRYSRAEQKPYAHNEKVRPASPEEVAQADAFEREYGIRPYYSDGQLDVPVEAELAPKYSVKPPYAEKDLAKGRQNHPILGVPLNKNGTVTLYFPTSNEHARAVVRDKKLRSQDQQANRIYLTNESSPKMLMAGKEHIDKLIKSGDVVLVKSANEFPDNGYDADTITYQQPKTNKLYVVAKNGMDEDAYNLISDKLGIGMGSIDHSFDGANVLVHIDPSLLHLDDKEWGNGRKDFYIQLAEGQSFINKMRQTKLFTLNKSRNDALSEDATFKTIGDGITAAVDDFKNMDKKAWQAAVREAKVVLKNDHNVGTLLSENGKLQKTRVGDYGLDYEGNSVASMGLGLASAQKLNNKNLSSCLLSAICEALCLGETSGQNLLYGGEGTFRAGPRLSQYLKTEALVLHPKEFGILLSHELSLFKTWAKKETGLESSKDEVTGEKIKVPKQAYQAAIRLNVTSDFPPAVFEALIKAHPDVQFYDYTKLTTNSISENHHLTYSSTGASQVVNGKSIFNQHSNWDKMVKRLNNGFNVAMAFSDKNKLPSFVVDEASGQKFKVWDGDQYDARFLDPKQEDGIGRIIGLTNKDNTTIPGLAAEKHNGFFVHYDPAVDGDTVTIKDQKQFKSTATEHATEFEAAGMKYSRANPDIRYSRASQVETPEFKKWFGESKVVDAEGKPMVVYHGTKADEPEVFGTNGGKGIYFAESSDLSEQYTNGNGSLGEYYLKSENHLDATLPEAESILDGVEAKLWPDEVERNEVLVGPDGRESLFEIMKWGNLIFLGRDVQDQVLRELNQIGFTGVKMRDHHGGHNNEIVHVVFKPTQIKSATGNSGAFDANNPDIRYSRRTPSERAILERISQDDYKHPSITFDQVYTKALDDLNPIKSVSPDAYQLMRLMRGAYGKAQQFLFHGTYDFASYVTNGPGLKEILDPFKTDLDGLRAYMVSRRAVELEGRGITSGMPLTEAKDVIASGDQKYRAAMQGLIDYQDRVLNYLRDAGVVSVDAYDAIKDANKSYVPFFRLMDNQPSGVTGNGRNIRNPVMRITGSERDVVDPIESIIKNTYMYIELAERNAANMKLADDVLSNSDLDGIVKKVPTPMRPVNISEEETAKFLDEHGLDATKAEAFTIFRPAAVPLKDTEFMVYRDGKREIYETDKDIAAAVRSLDKESISLWMKIISYPAKTLRAGATLSPDFPLRNVFRDQISAFIFSKDGYTPFVTMAKGAMSLMAKDDVYQNWLKSGGANSALVSIDRQYINENVFKLNKQTKFIDSAWNVIKSPIQALRIISEALENATRLGEFKAASKNAVTKEDLQTAGMKSREITLDFARAGTNVKALNMISAFFNASLQGTDRTIRAAKEDPVMTMAKIGLSITLPSVLLWAANHDDDWVGPDGVHHNRWKEIPAWQRDLFWIVLTDNAVIRLPKPFELGVVFGSGVERALDAMSGDFDPKKIKEFLATAGLGILPNPTPTAVSPILEHITNYSFLSEHDLVPSRLEKLLPELQSTEYTSEIAKFLSHVISTVPTMRDRQIISPIVMENYLRSWTGGLGTYALKAVDQSLRKSGLLPDPVAPASALADIPVVKAFVVRFPSASVESITSFQEEYSKRKKVLDSIKSLASSGDPNAIVMMSRFSPNEYTTLDGINSALSGHTKLIRDYNKMDVRPDQKDNKAARDSLAMQKRQLIDNAYSNMIQMARMGNQIMKDIDKAFGEQVDVSLQTRQR